MKQIDQVSQLLEESQELTSIQDFIRWSSSLFQAEQLFFGHGTDNALDDAAALILFALQLPYDIAGQYLSCAITQPEREVLVALIARRITERKPVAYLTNESWFAGLKFYIDERTLVPRSPIAELIGNEFSPFCDGLPMQHILELGTGSGCIAIACAYAFPDAQVDAVDLSEDALAVAALNIKQHEVEDQVNLIHSDLFAGLAQRQYDLIVSNPPYVCDEEWRNLPNEFHTEPKMGFHGGSNGLDIVHRILHEASRYLTEDGVLIIEVGSSAETLQRSYPSVPFLWLDFEHGGDGVFLLTAQQLHEYANDFALLAERV